MKKLAIIAALLASVSLAHAQDAAKPPETPADASAPPAAQSTAPAPQATPAPSQPARFYLEMDQGDINALNACVQELPKRVADPLVLKINGQLTVQAKIAADFTAAMTGKPKVRK